MESCESPEEEGERMVAPLVLARPMAEPPFWWRFQKCTNVRATTACTATNINAPVATPVAFKQISCKSKVS